MPPKRSAPVNAAPQPQGAKRARLERGANPVPVPIPVVKLATVSRFSTPALLAWGRSYVDAFPAEIDGANRAALIFWLTNTPGVEEPTAKRLHVTWTKCTDRTNLGEVYVERHIAKKKMGGRAPAAQSSTDEEMIDEFESDADDEEAAETKPKKSAKSRAAPQKQEVKAWVSTGACPHCSDDCDTVRCRHCGMRGDIDADSPTNVHLAATHLAFIKHGASATPLGTSNKRAAAAGGSSESRIDTEFTRRAMEGASYPAAEDASRITSEKAFELTYDSYRGTQYRPASTAEIALLQSGRFSDLGFFVPTLLSDPTSKRAREAAPMAILTANGIEMPSSIEAIEVDGLHMYMVALFARLLPALINRPSASANWMALTCTILELTRSDGWPVAQDYLRQHLASKLHKRQPVGQVDTLIMQGVLSTARHSARSGESHGAAAARSSAISSSISPSGAPSNQICWNWNFMQCIHMGACRHIHKCTYIDSAIPCLKRHTHKAKECEKYVPPPAKQSVKYVHDDRRGNIGGKPGAKGDRSGSSPQ
jgi:hypothetical protein